MSYRARCLERKPDVCVVCGEDSTVEVHHVDGNRANNSIQNLVPVCTDCHTSIHSGDPEYAMWRRAFGQFARSDSEPRVVPGDRVEITVSLTSNTLSEIQRMATERGHSRNSVMRNVVRAGVDSITESGETPSLVPREILEEAEAELADVRARNRELEQRVNRLESISSGDIGELKELKSEKSRLAAENQRLRGRIAELEERLEDIPSEYHRLKNREDLKNELYEQFSQIVE